jgi:hypothetical protein
MAMAITGFNPGSGGPGTQVRIELSDMPADAATDNTLVLLSGTALMTDDVDAGGTVRVTIDENSQSGDFVVIAGATQEHAQSAGIFTVQRPEGEPVITGMMPRTGAAGTLVTLNGKNLDEVQYVTIGTTNVMVLSTHTANMIRFAIPQTVAAGNQRVYGRSQEYGHVNCPYMLNVT